jgi:hypothetical protein
MGSEAASHFARTYADAFSQSALFIAFHYRRRIDKDSDSAPGLESVMFASTRSGWRARTYGNET